MDKGGGNGSGKERWIKTGIRDLAAQKPKLETNKKGRGGGWLTHYPNNNYKFVEGLKIQTHK